MNNNRALNEQQIIRREKLNKIKDLGIDPFYEKFEPKNNSKELKDLFNEKTKEELEVDENIFSISGRIIMFRNQGKAAFVLIKDFFGTIQTYIKIDELNSEKEKQLIELLDIGDVVGIIGKLMKTNTGELTLRTKEIKILAKCLTPLPDKFKGLEDIEEIYRKRYLDIMINDDSKEVFLKRIKIINLIRNHLNQLNFFEVETPILTNFVGGALAKPFTTKHNALNIELSLRIATEIALKKLIIGGFDRVYEIGRIFRNEGISNRHNPEFTSIELYAKNADYLDMMNLTETLLNKVASEIKKTENIEYENVLISFAKPFKKIEMTEIIKQECGIDFSKITFEEAKKYAIEHNIEIEKHWISIGYIMNAFFEEKIEKKLIQPTFITGYPIEISPLAKRRKNSEILTDRFELFIGAREYANGYSELNDSDEQFMRFQKQLSERENGNQEANDMDLEFIEALDYGLPSTGGLGIGIDRLVMLLTNSSSIRDVLFFPTQKPRNN